MTTFKSYGWPSLILLCYLSISISSGTTRNLKKYRNANKGQTMTMEDMTSNLTMALTKMTQLETRYNEAKAEFRSILHSQNSTFNLDHLLNPAMARLYSEKNYEGQSEDYNIIQNYIGVGCQNLIKLNGNLRAQSIRTYDRCVRIYSEIDCEGQMEFVYPGSESQEDIWRLFPLLIRSISPCFNLPYGKRYPDDLYDAITKNQRTVGQTQEDLNQLRNEVEDQQVQLEQLVGFRPFILKQSDNSTKKKHQSSCGGLIPLKYNDDPFELHYENFVNVTSNNETGLVETCIWLIHARFGGPIAYTLTSVKDQSSRTSLSLQPMQTNLSAVEYIPIASGSESILNETFVLLVFTSSEEGQGFTLQLRDLRRNRQNRKYLVTVNYLEPEMAVLSEYSYPSPTLSVENYEYLGLERRHIILRAASGKKIHLSIDSVDTEVTHDTLVIFSFSKSLGKFVFVRKYSGTLGSMTDQSFIGEENEPLFLYFHTDSSIEKSGFQFTYSNQPANESIPDTTTHVTDSIQQPTTSHNTTYSECGGLVSLPKYSGIWYVNGGQDNSYIRTCVWVIWPEAGGSPVGLTLESINQTVNSQSDLFYSTLSIQAGFSMDTSTEPRKIFTVEDIGTEILDDYEIFTLLVFTTRGPGQSFHLKLRDLQERRWRNSVNLTSISKESDQPIKIAYPWTRLNYTVNERILFYFQGRPNKGIKLTVDCVNIIDNDFLKVYTFSELQNKFQFYGRYSGELGQIDNATLTSNANQPILLYFHSEHPFNNFGFNITYIYVDADPSLHATINSFGTLTRFGGSSNEELLRSKFGACGGLISISTETELAYKNDGESSAEGKDEETCIWILRTTNEGVIGLNLLAINLGNHTSSSLTIQSHFENANVSTDSRVIGMLALVHEIVHEEPLAVLVFSSKTGHFFHITLRQLGRMKHSYDPVMLTDESKKISRTFLKMKSQDFGTFSYPTEAWSYYLSHERHFFILQPAQGEQVSLSINYIDMEQNYDFISLFKWSRDMKHFNFIRKFTGEENDLYNNWEIRGNMDEPLLVYFQSDSSRHGHGFRMTYSSHVPLRDVTSGSNVSHSDSKRVVRRATCGGLIPIESSMDLIYKNMDSTVSNQSDAKTCVWTIWGMMGGPIKIMLNKFDLNNSTLASPPVLSLQSNYQDGNSTIPRLLDNRNLNIEFTYNETIALLVFTGSSGQGFRLQLSDLALYSENIDWKVGFNLLTHSEDDGLLSFSYPPVSGRPYMSYERRHIILPSVPNRKIIMTLDYVHTEELHDHLSIFRFSKIDTKFVALGTYTGNRVGHIYPVFEAFENEPMFLYFHTDSSVYSRGFKIFFSYASINETNTTDGPSSSMDPPHYPGTFIFDHETPTEDSKSKQEDQTVEPLTKNEILKTTKDIEKSWYRYLGYLMTIACLSLIISVGLGCFIIWRENRGRNAWKLLNDRIRFTRRGSSENVLLGDVSSMGSMDPL